MREIKNILTTKDLSDVWVREEAPKQLARVVANRDIYEIRTLLRLEKAMRKGKLRKARALLAALSVKQ